MSSTAQPPQDAVAIITELTTRYPHHRVIVVGRMPDGLRWCVDGNEIYIQADPTWSPGLLNLRDAVNALDTSTRPALYAIDGGLANPAPLPATGSS